MFLEQGEKYPVLYKIVLSVTKIIHSQHSVTYVNVEGGGQMAQ